MKDGKFLGLIVLIATFTSSPAWACTGDYYSIPAGMAQDIDECGTCRLVTNGTASTVFIPTKTNAEWTAFYTNVNANTGGAVTVAACSTSCVYPLDTVAAPSTAFSLRKLRGAYAGPLIRIRRSSDNAETDIGTTGCGTLNTGAISTFVGAGNGFIRTWYDQSGNGRHATQITAGSQPRIMTGGTLSTKFGQTTILFDGSTFLTGAALGLSSTTSWSFSMLLGMTTFVNGGAGDGAGTYFLDRSTATNNLTSLKPIAGKYSIQKRNDAGGGLGVISTATNISTTAIQSVYSERIYNTAYTIYLNNVAEGTAAEADGPTTPPQPVIGRHTSSTTAANFGIYELIYWGGGLSSGDRTTVYQRQKQNYGF